MYNSVQQDAIDRVMTNVSKAVLPYSKEKERRIIAAAIAEGLGHGGIAYVSIKANLSRNTISNAIPEMKERLTAPTPKEVKNQKKQEAAEAKENRDREKEQGVSDDDTTSPPVQLTLEELIEVFYGHKPKLRDEDRQRKKGGGRKRAIDLHESLIENVEKIVSSSTYGNPETLITYTNLSLRDISDILERDYNQKVSRNIVGDILEILGYSKQQNQKLNQVGKDHEDRDVQFKHINETAANYLKNGEPVISIDCKKKENLGERKNAGQEYRKKKDPRKVDDHDFLIPELGTVAPYGVYTLNTNTGFVNLGTSHDTAEFSVASIRAWWYTVGKNTFPNAQTLYICSDGGGSNSVRSRLFKLELANLASETGLTIEVSHFPPGTSKWNKIEHRLFSFISKSWAGKTLSDVETVVKLIGSTTTKKGLKVICKPDYNNYETGRKVADDMFDTIDIEWIHIGKNNKFNYKIRGFKPES